MPHKKLAYEQGVQKALQDAGLIEKTSQQVGTSTTTGTSTSTMTPTMGDWLLPDKLPTLGLDNWDAGSSLRASAPVEQQVRERGRNLLSGTSSPGDAPKKGASASVMRTPKSLGLNGPSGTKLANITQVQQYVAEGLSPRSATRRAYPSWSGKQVDAFLRNNRKMLSARSRKLTGLTA